MFRSVLFGFLVIAALLALCKVAEAQEPSQGARVFADKCENCIVSRGHGFSSFDDDCNCFIICRFVGSFKLSSMASPWVGYKRCCGCGASFSRVRLTCVNYLSKKSDCFFGNSEATNPCQGQADGDLISRQDPADYDGVMCSGFITCREVFNFTGNVIVPEQECCPDGECFDGSCSAANCDTAAACMGKLVKDDCNCTVEPEPQKECPFMGVPGSPTMYMGIEMMYNYHCPLGTCFDEDYCACVQANNTGYTNCLEFVTSEFTGTGSGIRDVNITDGRGNSVYSENHNGTLGSGNYQVDGNDFLNIVGTAALEVGANFVFRIIFTLEELEGGTGEQVQCLIGTCTEAETHIQPPEDDTFSVIIERLSTTSDADTIEIELSYQDKFSMVGDFRQEADFNLVGDFENDQQYTLWGIFCAQDERVGVAVYEETEEDTLIAEAETDIEGAQKLLAAQSGFQLGDCNSGQGFEGSYELVELYNCKPETDAEYQAVFQQIFD